MVRSGLQQRWKPSPLATLLVVAVLELNILCNPFSPVEMLLRAGTMDRPVKAWIARTAGDQPGRAELSAASPRAGRAGGDSRRDGAGSGLETAPEIDDVVALPAGPKPSIARPLCGCSWGPPRPAAGRLIGEFSNDHFYPGRPESRSRLCCFRC